MKKKILGLCAMALAMAACQPDGFKVRGVAEGFRDGDTLYYYRLVGKAPTDTIIVKDGKFTIQGKADSVTLCSVVSMDGSTGAMFFNEDGNIDVTVSRNGQPKVGGTRSNNAWQKVNDLQALYSAKFDSLTAPMYLEEMGEEERQKVIDQYQVIEQEMLASIIDLAEANIDNAMGYFVVTSMAGSKELKPDRLKAMIAKMPDEYKQRAEIVEILKAIEAAENTAIGKTMPDFTLPTPEGEQLSALAEVAKHKYTILDFWASWCAPCCDEMPTMVGLYEQFRDKGLGILGISLDHEKDKWIEAISNLNMTWAQVGDMTAWKTPPVELFQVGAIPFTVVVDEKGTILEKGLRGTALELFIEEKMK